MLPFAKRMPISRILYLLFYFLNRYNPFAVVFECDVQHKLRSLVLCFRQVTAQEHLFSFCVNVFIGLILCSAMAPRLSSEFFNFKFCAAIIPILFLFSKVYVFYTFCLVIKLKKINQPNIQILIVENEYVPQGKTTKLDNSIYICVECFVLIKTTFRE